MKKGALIFLAILFLAIFSLPASAQAMSYVDFLSYGRRLLRMNEKPAPVKQDIKVVNNSLPVEVKMTADEKYQLWGKAYEAKDISPLFKNEKLFSFSEEEVNYFSKKEFDTASDPVVRNLKVDFTPGVIKISGYSFLKIMKGDFSAEAKIVQGFDGKVSLKVTKAKYGKIPMPVVLLDNAIKKETKQLVNFLYSDKDHQNLEIVINDNSIELKYKP